MPQYHILSISAGIIKRYPRVVHKKESIFALILFMDKEYGGALDFRT